MKLQKTNTELFNARKSGGPSRLRVNGASRVNAPNARQIWKQIDDLLVPRLRLSTIDRASYCLLLRRSRLEGKLRIRFTLPWLARGIRLGRASARDSLRRLRALGALRLVERTNEGHMVEVFLPEEILKGRPASIVKENTQTGNGAAPINWPFNLEDANFLHHKALRQSIHARERGRCFYCMSRTNVRTQCLDHVVPRALLGRDSYRNLVSCCQECNSVKGERQAGDFLCGLFREGRLTGAQLKRRLRAIEALAAGKLKPAVVEAGL